MAALELALIKHMVQVEMAVERLVLMVQMRQAMLRLIQAVEVVVVRHLEVETQVAVDQES